VLAQLCFGDQQCAQFSGRDDERFDLLLRMGVDESRSARELRQLAHEGSRPMGHDVAAATRFIVLSDVHPSGQNDRETGTDMAYFHERLAGTIRADLAETAHALDIRRLQNRKHLVAAGVDDRLRGSRHDERSLSTNVPRQTADQTLPPEEVKYAAFPPSESRTSLEASLGEELADHAGCAYQLLPHSGSDITELLRPLAGVHLGRENVAL
jgi:hypothetical protein